MLRYIKLTHLIIHFCVSFPLVPTPIILHFSNKNANFPNFAKLIRLRTEHWPYRSCMFPNPTPHTEAHGPLLIAVKPRAKCSFLVNSNLLFHSLKCNKNLLFSEELLQYRENVTLHLMALASLRPLRFERAHWCY
jgi:hypothetical protein